MGFSKQLFTWIRERDCQACFYPLHFVLQPACTDKLEVKPILPLYLFLISLGYSAG